MPTTDRSKASASPLLSFIVPVFNRLDLTRSFLRSFEDTIGRDDWEMIWVDNASSDGTADFLTALPPPHRVLSPGKNLGYAAANNRAAAEARGSVLGLLNNDLLLTPGWLPPMLGLLLADLQCGAVGNLQLNPRTDLIDHAGVFFDREGMPAHASKNRRRSPPGDFAERNAATAACLLLRRQVFEEAGGFHEGYRNGMEDIDLCVRLRRLGYRILVSHRSRIFHHVSSSPGRRDHDAANSALFRRRCSDVTRAWGEAEWPREYLRRYARHWWKASPARVLLALRLLLFSRTAPPESVSNTTVPSPIRSDKP